MIIRHTNIILFIYIIICCSCSKSTSEVVPYSKAVFVYMAADNDLDYYGIENINQIELALYQNEVLGTVYLYIDRVKGRNTEHPYLLKITPDNTDKVVSQIIKVYPEQNSCSADVFESSLKDVLGYC